MARRSVIDGKTSLVSATKIGVDKIIDVLKRRIDTSLDDDKIKSAVDAKNQAIKSIQETLLFIDDAGVGEDFLKEKMLLLIDACWECFDELTNEIIPSAISDDLEDNRMKNAILSKDTARNTCQNILSIIEDMEKMIDSGKITIKKTQYKLKSIESVAKSVKDGL